MKPLVSIIMPVYNSEKFLQEALDSVLHQTYDNWELLVINDGSTDRSSEILNKHSDTRIKLFIQNNHGVSSARNVGLKSMKGDYFCFLDSDDILPIESLERRILAFKNNPKTSFVDGVVDKCDEKGNLISSWHPSFEGDPFNDLVSLGGRCFAGLSWMIKRNSEFEYQMDIHVTHGEDLLFLIFLCLKGSTYCYIKSPVLIYRQHDQSAMRNLTLLHEGYLTIYNRLSNLPEITSKHLSKYKRRVTRIMFLSYMQAGMPIKALKSLL